MSKSRPKPLPMGRPRSDAAVSHTAIMDALSGLLEEKPARDLTMDAVAKRAGVGKPTLYKWWPSKAALIMAMFHERFNVILEIPGATTAEEALRIRVKHLVVQCNGLFGKVVADLIAEGQGDPSILEELYESHIRPRRASTVADIERGVASGEFVAETDPELLLDAIVAPLYLRLLLRHPAVTEEYGDQLIDKALLGIRGSRLKAGRRKRNFGQPGSAT
ncbi:TetR/AcrR family transcriptional regulator [Granulicella arctica]|uniref:TetR/AcrR family transcriptional regulator n=1 Tax=Granulicella arctica TaxID=940613 RepID=UPI0021E091A6|nr:TetR/AcrR family transcriptional regulator [Granulicella arctica]